MASLRTLAEERPPVRKAYPVVAETGVNVASHQGEATFRFQEALDRIQTEGNRTVVIDEGLYMSDPTFLNLGQEIGMLFYFGRSNNITMVLLSQRPAWIPKVVYSSATHAWIARTTDRDDLRRLSDFGGIDAKEVGEQLRHLPLRHDFLYLNPQGSAPPAIVNTRR